MHHNETQKCMTAFAPVFSPGENGIALLRSNSTGDVLALRWDTFHGFAPVKLDDETYLNVLDSKLKTHIILPTTSILDSSRIQKSISAINNTAEKWRLKWKYEIPFASFILFPGHIGKHGVTMIITNDFMKRCT